MSTRTHTEPTGILAASAAANGSGAPNGPTAATPSTPPSPASGHTSNRWLRRFALAALLGNILIVVTGGAVRLTASGLGCPEWPRCTADSYVNTPELGIHGYVEFGNRLLTFVLTAAILGAVITAWQRRQAHPRTFWLASALLGGVALQATIGGITVLTGLAPEIVAIHFLLSMGMIAGAYVLWRRANAENPSFADYLPIRSEFNVRPLTWAILAATFAALVLGTLVTGTGPHSGDPDAPRLPFSPEVVSRLHVNAVVFLVGLSLAALVIFSQIPQWTYLRNAAAWLLAAEIGQGAVGAFQHATGLPVGFVALHLLGACLVWLAAVRVTHIALRA